MRRSNTEHFSLFLGRSNYGLTLIRINAYGPKFCNVILCTSLRFQTALPPLSPAIEDLVPIHQTHEMYSSSDVHRPKLVHY